MASTTTHYSCWPSPRLRGSPTCRTGPGDCPEPFGRCSDRVGLSVLVGLSSPGGRDREVNTLRGPAANQDSDEAADYLRSGACLRIAGRGTPPSGAAAVAPGSSVRPGGLSGRTARRVCRCAVGSGCAPAAGRHASGTTRPGWRFRPGSGHRRSARPGCVAAGRVARPLAGAPPEWSGSPRGPGGERLAGEVRSKAAAGSGSGRTGHATPSASPEPGKPACSPSVGKHDSSGGLPHVSWLTARRTVDEAVGVSAPGHRSAFPLAHSRPPRPRGHHLRLRRVHSRGAVRADTWWCVTSRAFTSMIGSARPAAATVAPEPAEPAKGFRWPAARLRGLAGGSCDTAGGFQPASCGRPGSRRWLPVGGAAWGRWDGGCVLVRGVHRPAGSGQGLSSLRWRRRGVPSGVSAGARRGCGLYCAGAGLRHLVGGVLPS